MFGGSRHMNDHQGQWAKLTKLCQMISQQALTLADAAPAKDRERYLRVAEDWVRLAIRMAVETGT